MFGVYLPQVSMSFPTIVTRVSAAEEAGFDSVWFMDHMATPMAPQRESFEGWTLVSALGPLTSTIRLGHLVLCDAFRHPALLAKMAATLDVITEGRFELGLGWGSVPTELRIYGFREEPPRKRSERMAETLEVLELLFTGEAVSYEGRYVSLHEAVCLPRPVQDPLPVHIGGGGATLTMPLVARYAHWWNCPSYALSRLGELLPTAGNARVSVQHPIGLAARAADKEEVAALAQRRFAGWGGLVTGTPDEVAAALSAEAAAGVELFIVQFSDFCTPETIDLFAREVIPAVRECTPSG